jgi:hypothetical protein
VGSIKTETSVVVEIIAPHNAPRTCLGAHISFPPILIASLEVLEESVLHARYVVADEVICRRHNIYAGLLFKITLYVVVEAILIITRTMEAPCATVSPNTFAINRHSFRRSCWADYRVVSDDIPYLIAILYVHERASVVVQHVFFDQSSARSVNRQSFVYAVAHRIANERTSGTRAHVVKMQTIFCEFFLTTLGQLGVVYLHDFVVPFLTSCEPIPRYAYRAIQIQYLRVDGDTAIVHLCAVILVRVLVKTDHTRLVVDGRDLPRFCSVIIIDLIRISARRPCPSIYIAVSN